MFSVKELFLSEVEKNSFIVEGEDSEYTPVENLEDIIVEDMESARTPEEFQKALNAWLKEVENRWHTKMSKDETFSIEQGPKYIKIARNIAGGKSKSIHAFIDKKTGDILKAASWKAPAKGARGNLWDDKKGLGRIDPYGFIQYNK